MIIAQSKRWLAVCALLTFSGGVGCATPYQSVDRFNTPPPRARDRQAAKASNDRGIELASIGQHAEAEKEFRESIAFDSSFASAHNNLGLVLLHQGKLYDAAVEFRTANQLNPQASEPLVNLGKLYEAVGWDSPASRFGKGSLPPQHGARAIVGAGDPGQSGSDLRDDAGPKSSSSVGSPTTRGLGWNTQPRSDQGTHSKSEF